MSERSELKRHGVFPPKAALTGTPPQAVAS